MVTQFAMDLFNDPFFIGFNRELGRLNTAHKVNSQSYPPYDLLKLDEDTYRLSTALAGFTKEDINVSVDNGTLVIKGEIVDVTDAEVANALAMANAQQFIDEMPEGLDTEIGERGASLSGGQRQRLAIARAIIRDPKILILDEATSALDTESELLIQDAISKLRKDRTTFIVAHRLSTVRDADRIAVMENGRIVEIGTHNQLIEQSGRYKELVNTQNVLS